MKISKLTRIYSRDTIELQKVYNANERTLLIACLAVILRSNKYGTPIDMWSFGCVVAELIIGYPLLSGEDEHDQVSIEKESCVFNE